VFENNSSAKGMLFMHIVGGLYRELCCVPEWNAVWGSGGRAAAALSLISPGSTLYSYAVKNESVGLLERLGLQVELNERLTDIVFAYFHPLSKPHIEPNIEGMERQQPIKVDGDAVLRFGFIEGDAIVTAKRAVYDPQTWRNPVAFRANGSTAQELAIVLNELELFSLTNTNNLELAVALLMEKDCASIVVVKRGFQGATVFDRSGQRTNIPAYKSSKVFKIGTGDIFSAIFAHYWAEKSVCAIDSAHIASRFVAAYCDGAGQLPIIDTECANYVPVKYFTCGAVLILGAVDTLGRRYVVEEAKFVFHEFGINAFNPVLDKPALSSESVVLVIADGFNELVFNDYIENAKIKKIPIVIMREGATYINEELFVGAQVVIVGDFSSAIYHAAWVTCEST
jgi:hypothetical protein